MKQSSLFFECCIIVTENLKTYLKFSLVDFIYSVPSAMVFFGYKLHYFVLCCHSSRFVDLVLHGELVTSSYVHFHLYIGNQDVFGDFVPGVTEL